MGPFDAVSLRTCTASYTPTTSVCPSRAGSDQRTHGDLDHLSLLAAIASTDLLQFPLRVEPGDRPDLLLSPPTGQIGVELTEAISTSQAQVAAMAERDDSSGFRPPTLSGLRPSAVSGRSQGARPRRSTNSRAHGGLCERDWVDAMLHNIGRKTATLLKPGFAEHRRTGSSFTTTAALFPALDEQIATERLNRTQTRSVWSNPFQKVFVLRPRTVWEFEGGPVPIEHRIPAPWLPRLQNE